MHRITHLQLQRRRADRVNVYLDEEFAFSLILDLAIRLKIDQSLTDHEIAVLQSEDAYREALDRALHWLSVRPRSCFELQRYLADKEVPPIAAGRVADRLAELEYLDDRTFAQWWVDSRSAHRPRGRALLRQELSQRGVAPDIIAEVTGAIDEPSAAVELAMAQAHRYAGADRTQFNRRLGSYLSRRGFGYGAVREALAAAWEAVADGAGGHDDRDDQPFGDAD